MRIWGGGELGPPPTPIFEAQIFPVATTLLLAPPYTNPGFPPRSDTREPTQMVPPPAFISTRTCVINLAHWHSWSGDWSGPVCARHVLTQLTCV